jgi:SAM-dependent methyltransferase
MEGKVNAESTTGILVMPQGVKNHDRVRNVFENAPRYLKSRQVDIRFRIDTVREYASRNKFERGLDIGCGDGSISLQLVTDSTHFTLMDLSSNMVARAKANVPEQFTDRVEVRNENFASAEFDAQTFDLIMSVGVMAHVDSPDEFLQKIKSLLPPGGHLILEFTDAFHFVGRIGRFWGWLKELIAPATYATNKLSYAVVSQLLDRNKLKAISTFRYSRVPLPGFNVLVSHANEYKLMKAFFGSSAKNRNAWLGNEYIFLLKSE